MPKETQEAVNWAKDNFSDDPDNPTLSVTGLVREYFNNHEIKYGTFTNHDLEPYM